jgi:23S rRNA (uracil-5-)-methyltransferase RumA
MAYEAQLDAKRDLLDRELAAAAVDARVNHVVGMEEPWRYRRTASLAIGWEAGFRPRGRRGIIEIQDCAISHPMIGRFASELNRMLGDRGIPNYHGKLWLDCTVVGSEKEPNLQVLIQGIEGLTLESHPELPKVASVLAEDPDVASVAFRCRSGKAVPLVGDLAASIEIAGRRMRVPAGSFVQTNIGMLEVLMSRLTTRAGRTRLGAGADVYSGIGTFGLPLARQVDRMTLIELDAQAVEASRETASEWGLTNVDFLSAHAERAVPSLPNLDLVVVDPARSGLAAAVVDALMERQVPLLFYVSCSPRSLARDLARLIAGGYRVESLDIFDFYPHTYHVESLAVLSL